MHSMRVMSDEGLHARDTNLREKETRERKGEKRNDREREANLTDDDAG